MGWSAGAGGYDYSDDPDTLKKSAQAHAQDAGSAYQGEAARGVPPPVGKTVRSDSPTPLVFAVDVTGSMGEWPGIIFHKLPVLYHEAKLWLPEIDISFAAIGDAYTDRHPVQVCDFAKDRDLETHINSIFPEGGGGGQARESYELFAYFYTRHCEMPKAQKALFVYCGDEGFYDKIRRQHLQTFFGDTLNEDLDSRQVFEELCRKFEVYNLRVKYSDDAKDAEIRAQWQSAIGNERVLRLEDPHRIVDCILGLTALVANDYEQFRDRLAKRQTEEQVEQVMKTLHPLLPGAGGASQP
jgi:hypothetical protein